MRMRSSVILVALMVLQGTSTDVSSASDKLAIELKSDKPEYVLGETVVLQIAAKNESAAELPVWVDELQSEIQVFLGTADTVARQFEIGGWGFPEIYPSTISLSPGKQKRYALRLLYSFGPSTWQKRASTLAFPETGQYEIHVRYPLPPKRQMFESNTIRIHVKEPKGVDAEIWKRLNHPEMLLFLQHGAMWPDSAATPLLQSGATRSKSEQAPITVAEILTSVNESSYHTSLRWALGKHYYHLRITEGPNRIIPNPEDIDNGKLYRKALGIVLQHPTDPLAGDPRLFTRRVVAAFLEMTPIEQVFAVAEQQTGVPLVCDPALKTRSYSSTMLDQSLAQFMLGFSQGERLKWIPDGRGYRLVPVAVQTDASQ